MKTTTLKAIETRHKGYRFRSRLEARWAVYLDTMGIRWLYESEGYDLGSAGFYLPDFYLPQVALWAEVKPEALTDSEMLKVEQLAVQSRHGVVLLVGVPGPHSYWTVFAKPDGSVELDDVIVDARCLDENRFFRSTGFDPDGSDFSDDPTIMMAVNAARSARFEFGEHQ
jgi:hypothetical protein